MKLVSDHNKTVPVKGNLAQVIAIHLVTLAIAPFLFTGNALIFAVATALLFSYAMSMFHHGLLTHRTFHCAKWVEKVGALLGTLTWRGPMAGPVRYVAIHRIHHAHADTDLDPHTPEKGIFFALLAWLWNLPLGLTRPEYYETYAEDVAADRFHVFLDRNVNRIQLGWGILCFLGGTFFPALAGGHVTPLNGLRYLVYGVFVRALIGIYLGGFEDVVSHTAGYRAYPTRDQSANSFLLAPLRLGGAAAWHNNHHAFPHYFHVRRYAWEIDGQHAFLKLLSRLGLVWDVQCLNETRRAPKRGLSYSPAYGTGSGWRVFRRNG